jgi:hypothetical protein
VSAESGAENVLRSALLVLFVVGSVGTGVELLLLGHTEDTWQWTPLVLMGLSVPALTWFLVRPGRAGGRTLQVLMGLFVVGGVIGLSLHYRGNAEFELEMYPSLEGFGLFWEAVRGATPVLAPGMLIELGLLGLAYTYRHPALDRSPEPLQRSE